MCQCLEGEKVDWENLRTPEQQQGMTQLFAPMLTGLRMGATPFSGQMSAPMTDMQKMAAKTMSGIGGYGWEQQSPKYKAVPNMYKPENIHDLPVRGQGTTSKGGDVIHVNKKKGDGLIPPGPGPDPKPEPDDVVIQMLMALGMGGSPYDPTNRMG